MANSSVTMRDIAKSLHVSTTTVSKALNGASDISEKTRSEVLQKVAEMGFVPNFLAANLRKTRANLVALLLSDVTQPYFTRMIAGCEKVLEAAGYMAMTFNAMESHEREARVLQRIGSMNFAGLIIDPAQGSDPEQKLLRQIRLPYVFSNRYLDEAEDYYVVADNRLAGFMATRHLLERRPDAAVICVNGPDSISPTVARFQGYLEALAGMGVSAESGWVFDNCYGLTDAYRIGKQIARRFEPPFSVFCSTDQIAIGLMRALQEEGLRAGNEFGIIGVDDIDVARYLSPALTTVSLPREQIGRHSAEMLIRLIRGEKPESPHLLLKPTLVIRETT